MSRLVEFRRGDVVRILQIDAGRGATLHLMSLGLDVGQRVQVLRCSPFGGPMMVQSGPSEVAIGRGLAEKILVERA